MNRQTSGIARLGQLVLLGVLLTVPVLIFVPQWIVAWDYQSIDVGDAVSAAHRLPPGNRNRVISIEEGTATIRGADGDLYTLPVEALTEL